ncbi:isochorismatase family protein [Agaribacterium sp. ZY112]|uniref:isochorismatase family protein n=1 Tax=Agaribacterium sp. ZY112 TaxID=3233574 RepID=UPI0035232217
MAIPRIAPYQLNDILEYKSNKVDWQVDTNKCVLLVHDMQQYFIDFYDKSQEPIPSLIKNIKAIIDACHEADIPVVYTAQPGDQTVEHRALLSDFWGPGLKADERLTRILPELAPKPSDTVLTKWRYSAFQRSDFLERFHNWKRDQLIVVGVYAHIGCLQTCMEAFMSDIKAFMVSDAVADFSPEEHAIALDLVAGRCGMITHTQALLQSLKKNVKNRQEPLEDKRKEALPC